MPCDALQGDSGSPLFIADGAGYRLIGVDSRTDSQPPEAFDHNVATYADWVAADFATLVPGAATTAAPTREIK